MNIGKISKHNLKDQHHKGEMIERSMQRSAEKIYFHIYFQCMDYIICDAFINLRSWQCTAVYKILLLNIMKPYLFLPQFVGHTRVAAPKFDRNESGVTI